MLPEQDHAQALRHAWTSWAQQRMAPDAVGAAVEAALNAINAGASSDDAASSALAAVPSQALFQPPAAPDAANVHGHRDGTTWRPGYTPSPTRFYQRWSRRTRIVLAALGAAVLALVGSGIGVGIATQHSSVQVCGQSFFTAGGTLSAGDPGCAGFHVGPSLAIQDCVIGQPNQAFAFGWIDSLGNTEPATIPTTPNRDGCVLQSTTTTGVLVTAVEQYNAPLIVLADFTPRSGEGAAVFVGWGPTPGASITLHPHGSSSVAYVLSDGSKTLAQGSNSKVPVLFGTPYRLVLRVAGGQIDAWLNGTRLANAASSTTGNGYVSFGVGNGVATIDLTRIEVRASA
jgi:hypothetical protein